MWIFHLTKLRLENVQEQENRSCGQRYVARVLTLVKPSEKVFLIMFGSIFGFFFLFTIVGSAIGYSDTCQSHIFSVKSYIEIIFLLGCFIGAAIILRKAHDAYFIKNEFRLLGCLALFALVGIAAAASPKLKLVFGAPWGIFIIMLANVVTFIVPCCLAFKEHFAPSSESERTETASTPQGSNVYAETEEEILDPAPGFGNYPKIVKLLSDPLSYQYLETYLVHYQLVQLTDHFNLWRQLRDFKRIDPREMTGKAYLLYKKFLSPNAYRFIEGIPDAQRCALEQQLDKAINDNTEIPADFFDEVVQIIKKPLLAGLLLPFFKSDICQKYKEKARLEHMIDAHKSGKITKVDSIA